MIDIAISVTAVAALLTLLAVILLIFIRHIQKSIRD